MQLAANVCVYKDSRGFYRSVLNYYNTFIGYKLLEYIWVTCTTYVEGMKIYAGIFYQHCLHILVCISLSIAASTCVTCVIWCFFYSVFKLCLTVKTVIFSRASSSSSLPPGETRVRTRCQKGGVCLENSSQPISGGARPHCGTCLLLILASDWWESGSMLRSGVHRQIGASLLKILLGLKDNSLTSYILFVTDYTDWQVRVEVQKPPLLFTN